MENLVKLLLINAAYALEATANGKEVVFAMDEDETEAVTKEVNVETPTQEQGPKADNTEEEKPLPNPKRKVYNSEEPAKTKVEKELFKIQWEKLGSELQEKYLAGEIDSEGVAILKAEEDEDFGDFGEASKEEPEAPEFTAEQVRSALKDYAKSNGKEEAYKVLAQFGAKKIADIKEQDFSDVMAEIQ